MLIKHEFWKMDLKKNKTNKIPLEKSFMFWWQVIILKQHFMQLLSSTKKNVLKFWEQEDLEIPIQL